MGNQFNGRFDYNFTPNDLFFASAYITHLNQFSADTSTGAEPDADVPFKPLNVLITAAYMKNFGATTINELRGNFTRFADNQVSDSKAVDWGVPRIQVEAYPGIGNLQVAGAPWGTDTPAILAQNTYEVRDAVTRCCRTIRCTLAANGDGSRTMTTCSVVCGRFIHSQGLWNLANSAPIYEQLYANAMTGGPANSARYFRDHESALFVEDDWHVSQSLTLNLGLRWEYFSPLTEERGQL